MDFGSQRRLPRWFRRGLRAWLARFHVSPRDDLAAEAARLAEAHGATCRWESLYRDYAQYAVIRRPPGTSGRPLRKALPEAAPPWEGPIFTRENQVKPLK